MKKNCQESIRRNPKDREYNSQSPRIPVRDLASRRYNYYERRSCAGRENVSPDQFESRELESDQENIAPIDVHFEVHDRSLKFQESCTSQHIMTRMRLLLILSLILNITICNRRVAEDQYISTDRTHQKLR